MHARAHLGRPGAVERRAAGGTGAAAGVTLMMMRPRGLSSSLHCSHPSIATCALPPSLARATASSAPSNAACCCCRRRRSLHHPPSSPRPVTTAAAAAAGNNDSSGSSTNGEAAYANLFNARVFADPERQAEFERCTSDLRQLSMMAARFPDMDVAGKRLFLQAMEDGGERYRIFIARLELARSTDKAAADYLEYTSQQMAAGGFSIGAMFEGLAQSLERYQQICDAEEKAEAAGPEEARRFREALKAEWGQSALGAIDMKELVGLVSPEDVARAQADPDFYRAIREISESPTPDVLARWISHEKIGPLVTAMSKLLLQKRGLGGVGGSS